MKTQSPEEWEAYLESLLGDGVPADHVASLRAKGRHRFAEEVRAAMRRGAQSNDDLEDRRGCKLDVFSLPEN